MNSNWDQAFNFVSYERLIRILEIPINIQILYSTPKVMFDTKSTSKNLLDLLVNHINFVLTSKDPYNFYGSLFEGDEIIKTEFGTKFKRGKLCFQFLEENINSITNDELLNLEKRIEICLSHKSQLDLIVSENESKLFNSCLSQVKSNFEKPIKITKNTLSQISLINPDLSNKPNFEHIIVTKLVKFLVNSALDFDNNIISSRYIANKGSDFFKSFVIKPTVKDGFSEKFSAYEKTLDIVPKIDIVKLDNEYVKILREFSKIEKITYIKLSDIIRLFYSYDIYDSDNLLDIKIIKEMIRQPDIVSMIKVYINS